MRCRLCSQLLLGALFLSFFLSLAGCSIWRGKSNSIKVLEDKLEQEVEARDVEAFQNQSAEFFEAKAAHHQGEADRNNAIADARREADTRARIETLKSVAFWIGAGAVGLGILSAILAFLPYFAAVRGPLLWIGIGCIAFGACSIAFSVYFIYFCWFGGALLLGFGGWFVIKTVKSEKEIETKKKVASEFARAAGERLLALPKDQREDIKRQWRKRQRQAGIHDHVESYLEPLREETKKAKAILQGLPS